jgi:hypothetical protein
MRARPLLFVLLLGACPSPVADTSPVAGDTPAPRVPEPTADPALAHAHEHALKRLRDASLPALSAFEPVAAAALGLAPLVAPPVSRASRQALREQLTSVRRERRGIEQAELPPEPAMLLVALQHATHRIDDELAGNTPLRTEPGAYLDRVAPMLGHLERGVGDGTLPASEAEAALRSLSTEIEQAPTQLGGASASALAAAIVDARALADRLRRLPALAPASEGELSDAANEAAAKVDALRAHLDAIEARLADARPAERGAPLPPAADPIAMRRLPARLGARALTAALSAEAIAESPSVLLSRVVQQIARLHAMAEAWPAEPAAEAAPVTMARCEAAWRPIAAWLKAQPALSAAALDCGAFVRRQQGVRLDEPALQIELVIDGVVIPTREARRREVDPALALVAGDFTPSAQRDALSISVLAGAGLTAGARRATEHARDAACLAGAALLVHEAPEAELDVVGRLGAACAHRSSTQWSDDALARPHRSLRGLGLTLVGTGPADALAMQRFWWAPMGLVRPLAMPPAAPARAPAAPGVTIEPLEPER